ncbi:hypothetical protein M434DRAFT_31197 [Hypoxylon sp. CO27-5]|nr:hypothetical protein M434DRAFT_31197 [Hypoxylon sp. CO27-5]
MPVALTALLLEIPAVAVQFVAVRFPPDQFDQRMPLSLNAYIFGGGASPGVLGYAFAISRHQEHRYFEQSEQLTGISPALRGTNRHNREDPVDPNPSSNTEVKASLEKGRNTGFWITRFNGSGTITSSHPTPCPSFDWNYWASCSHQHCSSSHQLLLGGHHCEKVEFLETFKTCNPLGDNLAGPIKVVEKVVVSEMKKAEFIFYRDTKLDLRVYRVDVYCTARDSQTLENNSDSSGGKEGKISEMVVNSLLRLRGVYMEAQRTSQTPEGQAQAVRQSIKVSMTAGLALAPRVIMAQSKELCYRGGSHLSAGIFMHTNMVHMDMPTSIGIDDSTSASCNPVTLAAGDFILATARTLTSGSISPQPLGC